jgi:deoxyribonuclease V
MDWPTTFEEARELQATLREKVITRDALGAVRTVAGVDAGYENVDGEVARAAVVALDFPSLAPLDFAVGRSPATFPYVPGFLSFREIPAVLIALDAMRTKADLLICDGQGIAHPRRLGIASHLGVLLDVPTIGCAKSRLTGRHGPVPDKRGAHVPLVDRGEIIGAVLRTRPGTKPLYVSPGHRVSVETAVRYVMECTTRYRLPETTRAADKLASDGILPVVEPQLFRQR